MSLRIVIVSLLFVFIFISCHTLKYKFVEKVSYEDKIYFFDKIKSNNPFGISNSKIIGIYTEKNKSYRFETYFDIKSNNLKIKFFSILKNELIFEARFENNDFNYDLVDLFFVGNIKSIVDNFLYILNTIPNKDKFDLFITNDDYYVLFDKDKNYQKYDSYNIIKKENIFQTVKYYYENNKIKRIEYNKYSDIAIIIIEEITIYE